MNCIKKQLFFLCLAFFIFVPAARAEDVNLDKIVVTASRTEESLEDTGRNVDVVTSKEITDSGAQDLADALTGLTSVNISNYGGPGATESIRMRGSTAAQVLVLMDGRPVNSPRDGEADLSMIPLDNIARVEVMHGPGASLYGSGAMGGTVNIITKNPPQKGQKAEIYSSFGTARTYVERALYGGSISGFSYLASGEYQNSQGFRENSEFDSKDCNLKLGYEINSENRLTFNSGFYKDRKGTPGTVDYPDPDDKQNTLKNFFDFSWSFQPGTGTQIETRAYQNYDRLQFLENSTTYTKDTHSTIARGFNLQLNQQLLEQYLLICGLNYVDNSNNSSNSGKHEYNVKAGYLENRIDLFEKRLNLNLGARIDDYSNFGTEFNPSLSATYKLSEDTRVEASVSRSFRAPTFNDLYWPTTSYPWGGGEAGNPNLRPEKGVSEELGFNTRLNKFLNTGLTYFHSNYKQLIQWSENDSFVWQPSNVGSAVIDGLEFANKISLSDKIQADLNYTFLVAKDAETHKYLVYQPNHKVDCSLKYADLNGFTCGLKGQFTGQRFANASNTTKVKQFFTLGVSASKKFRGGLTCFASIDNLLNSRYQVIDGYPMPGFSFTGGAKFEF